MAVWTLAGELEKRGMTLPEACLRCGMDYKTMTILVNGGRTLPSLALKVGRGLKLKPTQVKRLGQPLRGKAWPRTKAQMRADKEGLPLVDKVEFDEDWWKQL